jgi:hypothetical protein
MYKHSSTGPRFDARVLRHTQCSQNHFVTFSGNTGDPLPMWRLLYSVTMSASRITTIMGYAHVSEGSISLILYAEAVPQDCILFFYQAEIKDAFSTLPIEQEPRLPIDFCNSKSLRSIPFTETFGIPMVFFLMTHEALARRILQLNLRLHRTP